MSVKESEDHRFVNSPFLCSLSGTPIGLSPRIEDTPMGCSPPSVASRGGDWVPKVVFTDDMAVVVVVLK